VRQAGLQQIVALIYNDWSDTVDPHAAQSINALAVHDCKTLDDPVETRPRRRVRPAPGWSGLVKRACRRRSRLAPCTHSET
jgi:hypothetical protein